MDELTPYDTGMRAEPKVWPTEGEADRFGKVDFDDDESKTLATAYIERQADGTYVLFVDSQIDDLDVEVR